MNDKYREALEAIIYAFDAGDCTLTQEQMAALRAAKAITGTGLPEISWPER